MYGTVKFIVCLQLIVCTKMLFFYPLYHVMKEREKSKGAKSGLFGG